MIAIIFKLYPRFNINNFHAIVFNYITCLAVGTFQLGEFPIPSNFFTQGWFPYVCILGVLFVTGFNLNALATQKIGISYTALIQKLSLVVPSAIAILFFAETTTTLKLLGISGAIVSIILIQIPTKSKAPKDAVFRKYTTLILGVFIIAATIETILFYLNQARLSTGADIAVVSSIFGMAAAIGFVIMMLQIARGKSKFEFKNVIAGICLGIPNFYSIYLLLTLLADGWEASVLFPFNNVGIIALSAIAAVLFFNEKLNLWKWAGLALAIISILLISYQ